MLDIALPPFANPLPAACVHQRIRTCSCVVWPYVDMCGWGGSSWLVAGIRNGDVLARTMTTKTRKFVKAAHAQIEVDLF